MTLDALLSRAEPEPNTGCWLWTGAPSPRGYGNVDHRGRRWRAHRLSYTLAFGPIAAGMLVRHRCDQPACVNPEHLVAGTQLENMDDARARNRLATGERHGKARFSRAEVDAIRHSRDGLTATARRFGTDKRTVWGIRQGHDRRQG